MIVIDSSAIIAVIASEPEAATFAEILEQTTELAMSALNLFECRTVVLRTRSALYGPALEGLIAAARVKIHAFDEEQAELAFDAYRRFGRGGGHPARLNLGDCAAYALATALGAPLLFKGNDFSRTDVRSALP